MAETFSQSHTGTEILKGVSRSFYLSLRLLPRSMRDAASLGYLLARSSDTIADTAAIPVSHRLRYIDAFSRAVQQGDDYTAPDELLEHCTAAETILMGKAQENLLWLKTLSAPELDLVRDVMQEIISGQRLDLERFGNATADSTMLIQHDAELLDYCQRVAGSVGVFWTKLGFLCEGERFSCESPSTMMTWGKNFGCALQLVNILRDRPEDLRHGRYYLPHTAHLPLGDACLHAQDRWLNHALTGIQDGMKYAQALKGKRLRSATVLPALLAIETIEKMQQATWQELEQRVKVSKATVFRCMAEALLF